MTTVKFLHTADWHLGMRRHFLGDDALPRFMQARVDTIRTIGELVDAHGLSFVVVAGDVWESNQLDRRTVGRALDALASLACPVYLLPGNHDPLDAASIYRAASFAGRKPPNVHVLDCSTPVAVLSGVELVGVPWHAKSARRDLVAEACDRLDPTTDGLRVCVAHGIVDGMSPDRDDPSLISQSVVEGAVASGRVHYFALGDRHSTKEVAPRVWYSGSPEPTDYDEVDSGNALVVELSRDACTVTPVHTGRWHFVREALEFSCGQDVDVACRRLHEIPDQHVTALKLTLKGSLSLAAKARLDTELEEARELFAALEIWERHTDLAVLPDDFDRQALGLAGFARTAVEELQAKAEAGGEEAVTARDALATLYRLAMRVAS